MLQEDTSTKDRTRYDDDWVPNRHEVHRGYDDNVAVSDTNTNKADTSPVETRNSKKKSAKKTK